MNGRAFNLRVSKRNVAGSAVLAAKKDFPVPGTISGHDASSETEIPYSDSSAHSDPDPFPKPNPVNHKQEENRDD